MYKTLLALLSPAMLRSGPHRLDSDWTMISAFLHHEQQALERSNETKETYPFT